MEGKGGKARFVKPRKNASSTRRRYWTKFKEEVLLCAVKELVVDGWKAGNGWRSGFYKQVEKRLHAAIHGCDIKGEPHVISKLTVWKRDYHALSTLFGKNGTGLDPFTHIINIVGTEAWETNVRVNPHLEQIQSKPMPYYEQWGEIFGKDRANGADAHDLGSTFQQLLNEHDEETKIDVSEFDNVLPKPCYDENGDAEASSYTIPTPDEAVLPLKGKKRKASGSPGEDQLVALVGEYMEDTKLAIFDLSKSIRSLKEVDPAVSLVLCELEHLPDLTIDSRTIVASKIAASPTALALFFSMGIDAKISFVKNILHGDI